MKQRSGEPEPGAVGRRLPKHDGLEMVTGRAVYAADVYLPNMLYARLLRSPHPHARILAIDTRRARALAGVVEVVTGADCPGAGLFATEEVCFEGHKVAAVVARDPEVARQAVGLIRVRYEVLPAEIDPLRALSPEAPLVRCGVAAAEVRDAAGRLLPNAVSHNRSARGDVDAALATADAVVEAEYRVPFFHQVYMEPNAATARLEADGRLTIWTGPQGMFAIRDQVAAALKLPHGRIRVMATKVGGAFGAKNSAFVEPHAAFLAMRTGQPVQVRMDRHEVFLEGRPAPGCVIRLKTAARRDGTLVALDGWMVWDRGWTGGGGGAQRLAGLYRIPNVRLESYAVRTNKTGPGAYRAPGSPQTAFARECNMDLLARELGMDPLELRLRNALRPGDRCLSGTPLDRDWMRETLRAAARAAKWGRRRLKANQGRGIACGEWTNADGATNAFIAVSEDGSLSLVTGQMDITGVHTVLAQVVAEELKVAPERISVTTGDTDTVPYTSLSAGSKATYTAGTAAREAARQARARILEEAAAFLEVAPGRVELVDGGRVRVKRSDRSVGARRAGSLGLWQPAGSDQRPVGAGRDPPPPVLLGGHRHRGGGPRDRQGIAAGGGGGPGRGPRPQPAAGGGADAGRRHPGHRPGPDGGVQVRPPRPPAQRQPAGLRHPDDSGRAGHCHDHGGDPLRRRPVRSQGGRRAAHHPGRRGHRQRRPRRGGRAGDAGAGDPRADRRGPAAPGPRTAGEGRWPMSLEYTAPRTWAEAVAVLAAHAGARVLARGTDLVLRQRTAGGPPLTAAVDIKRVRGSGELRLDRWGGLTIGAAVTMVQVEAAAEAAPFAALVEGASLVGSAQIRNRATVAGNLCNAAPSADTAPGLVVLGARVRILGPGGRRSVPVERFFAGPGRTVLQPGEVVVAIQVPAPRPRSGSAYARHTLRRSMDIAVAAVGAAVELGDDGQTCRTARLCLGAVAPVPMRAARAEGLLRGQPLDAEHLAAAADAAAAECRPISDGRASADFRRHLVGVLTRRMLGAAADRAASHAGARRQGT
ncbi:MAG: molybdopterin cofactor-binding domain-containing protein [Gemmatimonadota bacterium]